MHNSIIVPAYNEEKRSGKFIPILLNYVKKNLSSSEVIIVNDGSKDKTSEKIKKFISEANADSFARIIGYNINKGKGNAVEFGVKHAAGEKILFIDADGAIQPNEISNMLAKLNKYDVVVGDRLSAKSKIKSNPLRKLTSFGFNLFVSILFQDRFRDNLCGFKGFRRNAAKDIFYNLFDKRWVFDVELFFKIKKRKYSLYSLPIQWKYVGGSRINMLTDPIKWIFRLVFLRLQLINYK
ncbi:MAG: glycosyltransferase [Nanoarchaeota archaeon]